MKHFVPVTKLSGTIAFSFWALVLHTPGPLAALVIIELILLGFAGNIARNVKAAMSLTVFAVFLAVVQLLGGGSLESAYVTGLRMLAMTIVFIILLTTTRLQDLTAALRFVPDFIAESRTVQEAQACRGLSTKGNILKKCIHYMGVVQPLMLKSLGRSETMALSLELRGFGNNEHSFMTNVRPAGCDYAVMALFIGLSVLVVYMRIYGIV